MADEASTDATADQTSADSATDTATQATDATATDAGEAALGDAGKKALDAMKADRNKARTDLSDLRSEYEAFKAKAEGKEAEHAASQEAQRVKDEALAAANDRIRKAEIRAAAAGKLSDPADALRFLDLSEIEVGSDGEIDASQIASAIDDLITSKPYLAAQGGQRFQGSADGGARKDASKPAQLTRAELQGMSPEAIVQAKSEGRLDDALGIKTT